MGPNLKSAIWMSLAIALATIPVFALSFFGPLKPLWMHVAVTAVLFIPGYLAIQAAAKHYHKPR